MTYPVLKRALLVEDDVLVAQALAEHMRIEGWEVDLAHTIAQAKQMITARSAYTLVLLDLQLPDGSGLTLAEDVHTRDPLTDIAIVTGYGNVPEAVQAIRVGVTDFLDKPVSPVELRGLLDRSYTRASVRRGPDEEKAERVVRMFTHMSDRLVNVEHEIRQLRSHVATQPG
jgi:DNA-binding NtrC family response regulator